MAGYDDPRFLQQKIETLERTLNELKRSTLPLLSYMRGPTPGWLIAGQVGPGPAQKSAMHSNIDGNQPGVAPRQSVTDPNGTVRFEAGNLAANGISQAQYGFRANNASGSPLVDSFGPISGGVMSSLGVIDVSNQSFTSTTFAAVGGSGITFTLARQANVLTLFLGTGNVSTANGNVGFLRARLDSGPTTSGNLNFGLTSGAQTSSGWLFVASVTAGSHSMILDAAVNATPQTFNLIEAAMQVFLLGS